MLSTFKPLPIDKNPEWLSVKYLNGNLDDTSIDNLDWDDSWYHPAIILGVNVPKDYWVPAYGFPEVEFRVRGNEILFRDSLTFREIGFRQGIDYRYIHIPRSQTKIGVHQLVALTLLPHPHDTYQLVVNHRDSDKTNNHPSNLEWTTYSQNNFHAFSEGPRGKTVRKIRIKSIETGEEIVLAGYQELARYVGDYPQGAHQAMERRNYEGRPYKGYICKYDDDPRTWEELQNSPKRDLRRKPDKIAVKDLRTGDVKIYTNFSKLLNDEEIRDFMVFRLLKEKVMTPWRGRCFQEVKNNKPLKWPQYPKEIIEVYAKTHASDKPIKVTNPDGSIEYHSGVTSWCEADRDNRCDSAVLSRYMSRNKEKMLFWRSWIFEYIDLSQYPVLT